jgi:hypothetical protein
MLEPDEPGVAAAALATLGCAGVDCGLGTPFVAGV